MKRTAKQKTRSKLKAERAERHRRRTRHGERKLAKRLLSNEPTAVDLEKGRPSDTGRYGA
jgi:hypothetical protein